jgi:DNA-binding CsgD family transcriptional regulator
MLAVQARVEALRGNEEECRAAAEEAIGRGLASGIGWATMMARLALAELELGLGNPREAIEQFAQLDQTLLPPIAMVATPDLIDACVRAGEMERAHDAFARFEEWSPVHDAPYARAMLQRCRAMLADDEAEADRLFEEALELHAHEPPPYERARTQLAYGEHLRRGRRKIEARVHLRSAQQTFEALGTALWAERARGELNATGETARKRDVSTVDELTPQELRVAQLVAAGATNRDAATQLFVSPKTVEYHLRKVFVKLGVGSRVELARVPLGEDD